MLIFVFSDSEALKKRFGALVRSNRYTVHFRSCREWKTSIHEIRQSFRPSDRNAANPDARKRKPKAGSGADSNRRTLAPSAPGKPGAFVYLDVAGFGRKELDEVVRALRAGGVGYGILDPEDRVKDSAVLFHDGASDYVGSWALKRGVGVERLKNSLSLTADGPHAVTARTRTSRTAAALRKPFPVKNAGVQDRGFAGSWDEIEEGKEYSFCLMFVELDNVGELKRSLGDANVTRAIGVFKDFLERTVAQVQGKLWMWKNAGGLVLFPFDGVRCDAVGPCLRLYLARRVLSAEIPYLNTLLSFRIALHVGRTAYRRRGETGTIVSDAINSVFHLGTRHLSPGTCCATHDILLRTPECLRRFFVPAGEYEGNKIFRMRLPL